MATFRIRPGLRKSDPNPNSSRSFRCQVRRPPARTAQDEQLLLEQKILRNHRAHATGATQRRGHDGPVKQGEQEVLHARDSVGQTSGATQRCLNPGFSERIGNSRRTRARCCGGESYSVGVVSAATVEHQQFAERVVVGNVSGPTLRGCDAGSIPACAGKPSASVRVSPSPATANYRQNEMVAVIGIVRGAPSHAAFSVMADRYALSSRLFATIANSVDRSSSLNASPEKLT